VLPAPFGSVEGLVINKVVAGIAVVEIVMENCFESECSWLSRTETENE
jgi:hypothetical protein